MRKLLLFVFLLTISATAYGQFDKYFFPKTLRFDYYHCGNQTKEYIFFDELIEEPHWAGNKDYCVDQKEYGKHILKVYDVASGDLIYSQGYCSLFAEWQTTLEAKSIQKAYPESVVMPFPKAAVRIEISSRDRNNVWNKIFEQTVDPTTYWIRKSVPNEETFEVVYSGAPEKKIDIVLLAEGYAQADREKFRKDCEVFAQEFFKYSPFKDRKRLFNIRGVWKPSKDSGASLPGEHVWKETAMDSHYYTFDSERYLMIDDFQKVRDLAANVPYDLIYILADTKKYGGGGIYNFYGISAAGDPSFAGKVYVHEFGHLLLGLGDEYVGTTGYDEFYNTKVEPWEENLTTLVDFDKKRWKSMLQKDVKIPTQDVEANAKTLGVYEGGGYQNKGIYRPWINCMMRDLHKTDEFCPVCQAAINYMIDAYTK